MDGNEHGSVDGEVVGVEHELEDESGGGDEVVVADEKTHGSGDGGESVGENGDEGGSEGEHGDEGGTVDVCDGGGGGEGGDVDGDELGAPQAEGQYCQGSSENCGVDDGNVDHVQQRTLKAVNVQKGLVGQEKQMDQHHSLYDMGGEAL